VGVKNTLIMKKLFFLLSISMLFQSCFSYKSIDYNNIAIEKKQMFEVKGVGGTYIEGRLVSKNEKTMILENNGRLQPIPVEEIYEVKVREFSVWSDYFRALSFGNSYWFLSPLKFVGNGLLCFASLPQ
jgi:hypothetical protein